MLEIAKAFGESLDQDDFKRTAGLLSSDCIYHIGDDKLVGPAEICASYENNMIEGRKKLDELEWGQSRIEPISSTEYYVHFTDYLTHQGKKYTHRCKQKLSFNSEDKIAIITHIHDQEEQDRLDDYYRSVGLK